MISIGVIGAGHLGNFHLQQLLALPEEFLVVGFFDADPERSKAMEEAHGVPGFSSIEALLEKVDAVDIVTNTPAHFACAKQALEQGKHVFIEKPVTHKLAEAETLIALREKAGTRVQVGHIERFNPAFVSAKKYLKLPKFIECHRLAVFNERGNDVSVVLDLMIHDLDILLCLIPYDVVSMHVSGVAVVSNTADICNCRLEFENGTVVNLTASRISMKNMRKMRIFQSDAYLSLDFLEKKSEIFELTDVPFQDEEEPYAMYYTNTDQGIKKKLQFHKPELEESNAIRDELQAFGRSIREQTTPEVSLTQATRVLKLAHEIMDSMKIITTT